LLDVIWAEYRPGVVVAASTFPIKADSPALLVDRPLIEGKSTAYVCDGFVCRQPTADPETLKAQLKA